MTHLIPRFAFILLYLCIGLPAQAEKQPNAIPKEQLHVYLLIGQSNMAGRAEFPEKDSHPIPRAFLLNDSDTWEKAKNPLNQYSTIRKKLKLQRMSPGYEFAREMLKANQDISIGLVANARGGTNIKAWQKGGEYYTEALRRTKKAMETGTLKGILWHQGEGDSRKSSSYLNSLEKLITDLRNDLGVAELPFIAGQVFYDATNKPNTQKINKEIAKLAATVPFTSHVSSEGLTTSDHTHFDYEGMSLLGKRYAAKMIKLQKK